MRSTNITIIVITIFCVFLFSYGRAQKTNDKKGEILLQQNVVNELDEYNMLDYLEQLVLNSNFPFFDNVSKKNIHILLDKQENFVYVCKVYSETSAHGTGTMGWISYDAMRKKLYNISAYLEFPKELVYDKKIEEQLLNKITETCGSIPEYVQPKRTILPFNMGEWSKWYDKQNYDNLPKESKYNYYYVKDNYKLNFILFSNPLHEGFVPYLYFILKENNNYKTFLLFSRYKNDKYRTTLGVRDKFYDIITIGEDSIISSLQLGNIPYTQKDDAMSFNIDKDLTIKVYTELMCSDDLRIPCDTLNTSTYRIQNDGKIGKVE